MNGTKFGRRTFLAAAEAVCGGLFLSGCGRWGEDAFALRKPAVPGSAAFGTWQEKLVSSACQQCSAGCAVQVRVVEGRAVKIDGNPRYPVNRGGLGPKGQAGLEVLYHPDRIPGPLQRDGERGSGKWKPVTWDAAISAIAAKLGELRDKGASRSVVVLNGEPRGLVPQLWSRFLAAYGSPNLVNHRTMTDGGKLLAMHHMQGVAEIPAYDWTSTRYVLGLGTSLFESWCQSIHLMQAASRLRTGMPGQRVKFVQVAARFSATAANADEFVPIRPGTYGALALGLAHVLVREKLHDAAFVESRCFGFENWKDAQGRERRGYRDLVMKDWPVARAADVTGVPAESIERLAREMVEYKPAIAVADGGAAAATNGLGTAMSIHALNALLGNLERPGGLMVQEDPPLAPWAPPVLDDVAKSAAAAPRIDGAGAADLPLGLGCVQALPEAVLAGRPYPVGALLLNRSNPVFSKPSGARWIEALRKIPLVVSFSPLQDDTLPFADYVLPDHTYLERWEVVLPAPGDGTPMVGLRQPVVAPVHDTRATGNVLLKLAKALGGSVAESFPWPTYRKASEERLKGLLRAKDGSSDSGRLLDLERAMERDGGWWRTTPRFEDWAKAFRTRSGKFEFFSQEIEARLAAAFPDEAARTRELEARGVKTRGDDLCLPHWEPAAWEGDPATYPFEVVAYRPIEYAEGGIRHHPMLRHLPTTRRWGWKERVEINPRDAAPLGLRSGDLAWIETPAGRRRVTVVVYAGIRPGTLGLPLGLGKWKPPPGEVVGGYSLLADRRDPLAGVFAVQGTRARLAKGVS